MLISSSTSYLVLVFSVYSSFYAVGLSIGGGSTPVSLSAEGLKLRSALELISSSSEFRADLDEETSAIYNGLSPLIEGQRGRPCVEEGIKKVQRLQLQLDRSDGRSDITPEMISNIYYDLMSTCLRTEGGAWVAPLGPLQYVGFVMDNFITIADETSRIIDVDTLSKRMGQVLIDAPSPSDTSPDAQATITRLTEDIEAKTALQDFLLSLLRTTVRFAALREQLEGNAPPQKDFSVALSWPEAPSLVCSLDKRDVEFMLACEFGSCDEDLVIPATSIKGWISQNSLG